MLRLSQIPLATRLSAFFLGMIGLVLILFSSVFFWITSDYLSRQVRDQATSTINALSAAVEISEQGVEWETTGRLLNFGSTGIDEDIVWCVVDKEGEAVDQKTDSGVQSIQETLQKMSLPVIENDALSIRQHERWLIAERWISGRTESPELSGLPEDSDDVFHQALLLRAAVSLEHSRTLRGRIAVTLVLLSIFVWLAALFSSKSVCSRALRPLHSMTSATERINVDHLAERLPVPTVQDELATLTLSFNALLDRLQESFERQQRFTGDASHQLRTPLTAILGQIEVALRRERTVDEYRRILSIVHDRSTHLKNIVEALLFLARADGDSTVPETQKTELHSFLKKCVASFAEHKRFCDLKFNDHATGECVVSSHPTLLQELVAILLDNALKFSQPGTFVTVLLRNDAEAAIVTIHDSGEGISAEDIPHLGEPFFRTESARRNGIQGVGLGVSVAVRLSAAIGATVSFLSEPGRGTTAVVRVPRIQGVSSA